MRKKITTQGMAMIVSILIYFVMVITIAKQSFFIEEEEAIYTFISYGRAIELIQNDEVIEITIYKSFAEIKDANFLKNYIVEFPDRTIFLEFVQNEIENGNNIFVIKGDFFSFFSNTKSWSILMISISLGIIGFVILYCYELYTKGRFFKKEITEKEKEIIAYHEAGHALVNRKLGIEVEEVSISTENDEIGYTIYKQNNRTITKSEYKNELVSLLSGRAAERYVFKENGIGCGIDLEEATDIARKMVTIYGMSDKIIPISFRNLSDEEIKLFGTDICNKVGAQIEEILRDAEKEAETIIRTNIELLHKIAQILLEEEIISGEQLDTIIEKYESSL